MTRRTALRGLALAFGASLVDCRPIRTDRRFRFCLNTGTINGRQLGLQKALEIASRAGYDSVEIWVRDLNECLASGAKAKEIASLARNLGLTIENAIDFLPWLVNDEGERRAALEQMRRTMELLREIGCPRIAVPPAGAVAERIDLFVAAERFAPVITLGEEIGVLPQLEVWGFSQTLRTLGEALFIAAQCGSRSVGILADVYHLHKGGTPFEALHYLPAETLQIFHVNDYPEKPREQLTDADRVLPGDGLAPWPWLTELLEKKSPVVLSLELFNRSLWELEPLTAAKLGLEKMKRAVQAS